MRSRRFLLFTGFLALTGCMRIIPYEHTNKTIMQEYDVYDQHFIYREHFWGAAGLALVGGCGGVSTSSIHHSQFFETKEMSNTRVIEKILIRQSNGSYKRLAFSEESIPWHQLFVLNKHLFAIVAIKPSDATDIKINLRYPNSYNKVQFIGEWDPRSASFLLDRYFPNTWDEPHFYLGPPTSPFNETALQKVRSLSPNE